ncbi:MAG: S8 family serine peptidase [Bdellovibrionales bacterium]|nr:S8 family serine peptidase [Bdellovibrionales bacterium]
MNPSPFLQTNNSINYIELGSKKGTRTTTLGKVVPKAIDKKQKIELQVLLNDPAMSQSWGLKTTEAQKAWRVTTGSKSIVVAIIDTGIDKHPDLVDNLWVNPGETGLDKFGHDKATNNIDDDGDGFVDDVHGWNFVKNSRDLTDNHGHGTHIAGIIGAVGGNGIGISGISPKVSMMILKYYDPKATESSNLLNTVKAINYAVSKGANIINYSGGGLEPSNEEKKAIQMAEKKGILFVAAAGNERSNSDIKKYYPADYGLSNIISVTAIDKNKSILPSSNYGEQSVDIAAPGNDIYSTLPNGQYGFLTGTSQATAFVSGVAALVMANNSELKKAEQIKKYLTQTGDAVEELSGKTRYHKVLNSYKALAIQDSDLSITGVRVENTLHMGSNTFNSDKMNLNTRTKSVSQSLTPELEIASFGKALQKAVVPQAKLALPKSEESALENKNINPYPEL